MLCMYKKKFDCTDWNLTFVSYLKSGFKYLRSNLVNLQGDLQLKISLKNKRTKAFRCSLKKISAGFWGWVFACQS